MVKKKIWMNSILDMIYPPRCPICHDIVESGYEMICSSCLKKLPIITGPYCKKCGKPVKQEQEYCHDCEVYSHEYTQGTSLFLYDDIMRSSIAHFKYLGRREYGRFYAAAIWKYKKQVLNYWNPEVIIPVPIHLSRKITRGYNQAEVLAKELSKWLQIPVITDAVIRKERTKAQKELTPIERRNNLEAAFEKGKNPFPWKRVLLIDDIYTTGSTVDAVSTVLKCLGAEQIYIVSVCIGKGFVL